MTERWDADLNAAAVRRLPPVERRLRTNTALRRKVEWIEGLAQAMRPGDPGPVVPNDKAALRRHHDPKLALWSWADRVVDAEGGPNKELLSRWRLALDLIRVRQRGGARALREEIALRDRRVAELELQVASLMDQRRALREELARRPDHGRP